MSIRTVVVDDETPARNRLRKLLAMEPDVEIIGECANGPEAIVCIKKERPDLAFLDLNMPQLSGMDVVRALPAAHLPAIVFVTAHDQHAVEAFEIEALDYLLKPFTQGRLQAALRRVRQRMQSSPSTPALPVSPAPAEALPPRLARFAVKDGNQTLFVKIKDVHYLEAAANYVVLCTPHGNHVLRDSLRNLETALSPAAFLRISRSIMVNINSVKAIRALAPGECRVVLHDGRELPMTRGFKEIQERLQYATDSHSPAGPDDVSLR